MPITCITTWPWARRILDVQLRIRACLAWNRKQKYACDPYLKTTLMSVHIVHMPASGHEVHPAVSQPPSPKSWPVMSIAAAIGTLPSTDASWRRKFQTSSPSPDCHSDLCNCHLSLRNASSPFYPCIKRPVLLLLLPFYGHWHKMPLTSTLSLCISALSFWHSRSFVCLECIHEHSMLSASCVKLGVLIKLSWYIVSWWRVHAYMSCSQCKYYGFGHNDSKWVGCLPPVLPKSSSSHTCHLYSGSPFYMLRVRAGLYRVSGRSSQACATRALTRVFSTSHAAAKVRHREVRFWVVFFHLRVQ